MRSDGNEFPLELAITQITTEGPPLFSGHICDLVERKRMEQAVAEERERIGRELQDSIWQVLGSIGIDASHYSLALVAGARGEDVESAGPFGEALRLSVEMGDRGNVAYCFEGLAGIAVAERKLEQAATL